MQRKLNKTINRSARIPTRKSRIARRRALVSRNNDAFGYNARSEVVFSRRGAGNAEEDLYAYDDIGNLQLAAFNAVTNTYTANNLNQRTLVGRVIPNAPGEIAEPMYDADGNTLFDGVLSFTYDSANRLKSVASNGVLLVTNFYDAKSRRVRKVAPEATTTFFYDGWNLIEERIAYTNGVTTTIRYYWGKDLSGTLQGAGGVGGLLYLTASNSNSQLQLYIPCYDNNGNITRYLDENGNTVAQYTYDAFGNTLSQSGAMCDLFRHRFSTKYLDIEANLYYYGYRFYHPPLMRWVNRDPIEEDGGVNLYGFCGNDAVVYIDELGRAKVDIPLDSFFTDSTRKKPFQISKYIDVHLGSLQRIEKEKYHYRVVFVARFTPPPEVDSRRIKQSPFSKFFWGDANRSMGGSSGMFEVSPDVGDVPSGVWRRPNATSLGPSRWNLNQGTRYDYPKKLFQFGYFEYRQESGAGFKKTAFNEDMYVDWEVGGAHRMLNEIDISLNGDMSKCDTVVVVYGDIGCAPSYLQIKP